jgi:hypothetical protein
MRESSGHKLSCLKNLSWALLFSATLEEPRTGRARRFQSEDGRTRRLDTCSRLALSASLSDPSEAGSGSCRLSEAIANPPFVLV